jgi:hypothetical protein
MGVENNHSAIKARWGPRRASLGKEEVDATKRSEALDDARADIVCHRRAESVPF